MITFTHGDLLTANVEAVVNTVNTVGVMGKGIALMFKEAFPENFRAYEAACKDKSVRIGRMFVTERRQLMGPRWIINFPTKQHWRYPSKLEWIESGLIDLRRVIAEKNIGSIALPPLGSGNGKLNWREVRSLIEKELGALTEVEIVVYEPTAKYQNVAKHKGVEKLTPARALIAELVRRYSVLGIECSILEIQKLAYFLERNVEAYCGENPLKLHFRAEKFGPYAQRLMHLLNGLDGSYLHSDKRLADTGILDVIWFDDEKRDKVSLYLGSEGKAYRPALDKTTELIDGFESPLGMELLATVDWLLHYSQVPAETEDIKSALRDWPGERTAGRKARLFNDRLIGLALKRLTQDERKDA